MWVVTIYFKEKTPWGFNSFGQHVDSENDASILAEDIMTGVKNYVACWTEFDHSCLYVKPEYVKAIGIRPIGKPKEEK